MQKTGFTLIELSIVLVIIGLIIGGVLVGRDLIQSAKNRATVAQIEQLNTAVNTFRLKYNYLPSDMPNSGTMIPGLNSWENGDGNGAITAYSAVWTTKSLDYNDLSGGETAVYSEANDNPPTNAYLVWRSLLNTGLLKDYATYDTYETGASIDPNTLPKSKNGAGAIVVGSWKGTHYWRIGFTSYWANLGGRRLGVFNGGMSPADAAYIYTKMDGGSMTLDGDSRMNPTAIGLGERIIPVSGTDYNSVGLFAPASRGAGGANAAVCMNTTPTPNFFNVAYAGKICNLMIKAQF